MRGVASQHQLEYSTLLECWFTCAFCINIHLNACTNTNNYSHLIKDAFSTIKEQCHKSNV